MKVLIKRFNGKDYFDEFEVDFKKDETILELLDRIRDYEDRSLTYRNFCRSSICGTCGIKVNEKSILACKSKVKDLIQNNKLVIKPLDRLKVIKDLAVDNENLEEKIKKTKAYFVDGGKELQLPEEFKKYEKQTDCILCNLCVSECEALDFDKNFAGPFTFSKVFRFVNDSRDGEDRQKRIEIAKLNGLYNCINCQKCVMVCLKEIASAYDIKSLQNMDLNPPFSDEMNFF